jgi:hypothetical protein
MITAKDSTIPLKIATGKIDRSDIGKPRSFLTRLKCRATIRASLILIKANLQFTISLDLAA